MSDHPIEGLMGVTMQKMKEMVDVDTIIGNPVTTPDGATIIPISKVAFGFGTGGSDFSSKTQTPNFGGGAGAGVSITPVAFLVVRQGDVKLLQFSNSTNTVDKVFDTLPTVFDKVNELWSKNIHKDKDKKEKAGGDPTPSPNEPPLYPQD